MWDNVYDYMVIGAGAAGLQLILAFQEDDYFHDKKIAVIEREEKKESDKTGAIGKQVRENGIKLSAIHGQKDFLSQETSFLEDARLISTFEKWSFLKAAARYKL